VFRQKAVCGKGGFPKRAGGRGKAAVKELESLTRGLREEVAVQPSRPTEIGRNESRRKKTLGDLDEGEVREEGKAEAPGCQGGGEDGGVKFFENDEGR